MLVYSILLSCEFVAPKGSRIVVVVVVVYEDERGLELLLLGLLGEQDGLNVGQDATLGNGDS